MELFEDADMIFKITRRELIEDGTLVDLSSDPELAPLLAEAGFRVPVAMTATAFASFVELTPAAIAAGQDKKGRLWDVLMVMRLAIRRASPEQDTVLFSFLSVVDRVAPELYRLKAVIGPDDDGKPCLTILLPDED